MKTIKKAQWVYRLCFCLILLVPISGTVCTLAGFIDFRGYIEYTIGITAIILAFVVPKYTDESYSYLRKQASELPKEDFISLLDKSGLRYSETDSCVEVQMNVRCETILFDSPMEVVNTVND